MPDRIRALDAVEIRLESGLHPHEALHGAAIDAHFAERRQAKPELHDGRTILGVAWRIEGARAFVTCRQARYATLLHWLATPSREPACRENGGAVHVFASAALLGSDGYLLFGQMAGHTANAGRVYFPSGSLDQGDFVGGKADLPANMAREFFEETGLALDPATAESGYAAFLGNGLVSLFRLYRSKAASDELVAAAERHLGRQANAELARMLALKPGETLAAMPEHVRAYTRWLARRPPAALAGASVRA